MIYRNEEELFDLFFAVHVLSLDADKDIFVVSIAIKDSKVQNGNFMDFFSRELTIPIVPTVIIMRLKQLQTPMLDSTLVFIIMERFLAGFLIKFITF